MITEIAKEGACYKFYSLQHSDGDTVTDITRAEVYDFSMNFITSLTVNNQTENPITDPVILAEVDAYVLANPYP
jgi:hypothetical protein